MNLNCVVWLLMRLKYNFFERQVLIQTFKGNDQEVKFHEIKIHFFMRSKIRSHEKVEFQSHEIRPPDPESL